MKRIDVPLNEEDQLGLTPLDAALLECTGKDLDLMGTSKSVAELIQRARRIVDALQSRGLASLYATGVWPWFGWGLFVFLFRLLSLRPLSCFGVLPLL